MMMLEMKLLSCWTEFAMYCFVVVVDEVERTPSIYLMFEQPIGTKGSN